MYLFKKTVVASILLIAFVILAGCSEKDNPLTSDYTESPSILTVQVQPPTFLRTESTQNLWNNPIEVAFTVDPEEITNANTNSAEEQWHLGTQHSDGMDIELWYGGGRDLFSMESGGMMQRHHAGPEDHHYMVYMYSDTLGTGMQSGIPMTGLEATVLAIAANDTFAVPLNPVMGEHGYRHESNTDMPFGRYDLVLRLSPPEFFRTEETRDFWTESVDIEFADIDLDSASTEELIGETSVRFDSGDSIRIRLSAASPQAFWRMGTGWTDMSGEETMRFVMETVYTGFDETRMPMSASHVQLTIHNEAMELDESSELHQVMGHHGVYYGENIEVEIGGETMHGSGGMHGGM